ncbi:unnamed protein product [Orchesella dallaii]|uniref:DNA-directed RNA polymerase I subunit RPA43 n=1 Tax=Orchesella dallaii TaxID=48710 RepID=A0ABP1S9K0_9HEXA
MMNPTILPDRFSSGVEFSKKDLQAFVDTGIIKLIDNHQQHIAVQPCWINDTGSGVMEEINNNVLGRWNNKLQAYVVYAENIRNYSSSAGMNEDHRWLHIDVSATFYTYTPEIGQLLKGEIKKVGQKAAVCMVFDVFTVTVFPNNEEELSSWNVGLELDFRISWFQHRRKGPILRAKSNLAPPVKNKKKKRVLLTSYTTHELETSPVNGFEDDDETQVDNQDSLPNKKRKKSKKDKSRRKEDANVEQDDDGAGQCVRNLWGETSKEEEQLEELVEIEEQLTASTKKKKKKKSKKMV